MSIVTNAKERVRFFRFAVVGAIGAVVDFGTFNLLTYATPILPMWASVISFIAAVLSNFTWNRRWTYPDSHSKQISKQLSQFSIINIIGLAIRTLLFALIEKPLVGRFEAFSLPGFLTPDFLGHNFALATVILIVMLWNFFANRYWTYNDVS